MPKKISKAEQERRKQIKRLKGAMYRAKKAGYVFDTSPIPEKATAKRLAKITAQDIRKQGYKLNEQGEKEYYSPYKARQESARKAQQTIAKKREDPYYDTAYLAQRKKAVTARETKKALKEFNEARLELGKAGGNYLKEQIARRKVQDAKQKVLNFKKELENLNDRIYKYGTQYPEDRERYELIKQAQREDEERQRKIENYEKLKAQQDAEEEERYRQWEKNKELGGFDDDSDYRDIDEWKAEAKERDRQENYDEWSDTDDGDYDYKNYKHFQRPEAEDPTDIPEIDERPFDKPITEEPDIPTMIDPETGEVLPDYEKAIEDYYNSLVVDEETGEAYGTEDQLKNFQNDIKEGIEAERYDEGRDGIILDEHSEPIALKRETSKGEYYVPYEEAPYEDLVEQRLNDAISRLDYAEAQFFHSIVQREKSIYGGRFYSYLQEAIEELEDDIDTLYSASHWEDLIEAGYQLLYALTQGKMTSDDAKRLEKAITEDRPFRTKKRR